MARKKAADRVKEIFNTVNSGTRRQWEYINQKGEDFANDNQLSEEEFEALTKAGMPTFTINRIIPIVEMLNFYATANNPRWQAVGAEGSDSDVAAVFSDIADYIWYQSNGSSLLSNCVNDAVNKSIGYLQVSVDPDADRGLGEVKLMQPHPFDIYVDPKSRDVLFKDASYIMIRKVLPKSHVKALFPGMEAKISKASSMNYSETVHTEKAKDRYQKDFTYKDIEDPVSLEDPINTETMVELYELFEKTKVPYMSVFYRIPPTPEQLKQIQEQLKKEMAALQAELEVGFIEKQQQIQQAVQSGEIIPQRAELELRKLRDDMQTQIQIAQQESMAKLQEAASRTENTVIPKKDFDEMMKDEEFAKNLIQAVPYHTTRIKQTCVVSDILLYEKLLDEKIVDYPIIPFHYKWTGTPFSMSAVAPLIGKQKELNKAHQLMVHNASLGSSLRWMYEEGAIEEDEWEEYSSSPGAMLKFRNGHQPPTPVQPMPLPNAFFGLVQQGKGDMEYLAGIYSSMQGDTTQQHETFRGMLAMDEYGTRRIKYWMKNSVEPALKQLGEVVKQYSQAVYTANKVFRIVQPNALQEEKQVEINIPLYNDLGEAIGKWKDYSTAKFDIRVISGSTLPINRWAYLSELKELLQAGVVDDMAVLAETDIRNKEEIAKRKSLYAQLSGQVEQLSEAIKDKDGTIETLERQLVQAGIKGKVMQAEMEINKKKEEVKSSLKDQDMQNKSQQAHLRQSAQTEHENQKQKLAQDVSLMQRGLELEINNAKKQLQNKNKE
tara:strand:- start:1045 stop:3369 length:2325 start_codon:yes stop_codon:yes gene_type:complete